MNDVMASQGDEVAYVADPGSTVNDEEHIDEAVFLNMERVTACNAPNYSVAQFADLDEALSARLDALALRRPEVLMRLCDLAIRGEPEEMFVTVVLALKADDGYFSLALQAAQQNALSPGMLRSVLGAFSFAPWREAQPRLFPLLKADAPVIRALALAGFGVHRVDPGPSIESSLACDEKSVRRSAVQAAGQLGRMDLLPSICAMFGQDGTQLRFLATEAATLLGHRATGLEALGAIARKPGHYQLSSVLLCAQAQTACEAHALLLELDGLPDAQRIRIIGSGYVGDAKYAPWLIDQMTNPAVARIAAEAFVHITGADFNLDQLEAMPPEDFEDGPSDDPDDDDVELPEDIALPWPDVERIKAWWMEHRGEFTPGQKLFLGKPITPEHCVHVLKTGFQRQRVIAAHYRCLIQPGTILFPTSAPAWRQQKLLSLL